MREERRGPDTPRPDAGTREEFLTSRETRQLLKIGRTKLWELTHKHLIPAYRLGDGQRSGIRYKRSELLAWLEENRI